MRAASLPVRAWRGRKKIGFHDWPSPKTITPLRLLERILRNWTLRCGALRVNGRCYQTRLVTTYGWKALGIVGVTLQASNSGRVVEDDAGGVAAPRAHAAHAVAQRDAISAARAPLPPDASSRRG